MDLNKVFLIGRLTKDPEGKMLPSGTAVANFSIATNRYYKDKSGEKQQEVEFHNISCFGKTAESATKYLKKGGLIFVEGRLKTSSWDDKEGNKKYKTEIVAERLQFGPKTDGSATRVGTKEKVPTISQEGMSIKTEEQEKEEINIKDIPFR